MAPYVITHAVRPGLKFRLRFFFFVLFCFFVFFLVQSQIAVWSLKRIRHLCIRTAHGIYRSCRRENIARIP